MTIFVAPEPGTEDAMANVGSLIGRPHVRTPGEQEGFWELYLSTRAAPTGATTCLTAISPR